MAVQVPGQIQTEGAAAMLAALIAGTELTGAKLHLYKAGYAPSPGEDYTAVVAHEADFTGYAAVAVTYSAQGVDSSGNPAVLTARVFFQMTDVAAPNNIGGAFLTHDATGPPAVHRVLEVYPLLTSINLTVAGQFIGVVLEITLPLGGGHAIFDS